MTNRVENLGREAESGGWLDAAVRFGLVAYGIVHLLIAWLAIQLALGDNEGKASSKGAMHQLLEQPFGKFLVWAIAVGMFLLVIWRVLEAINGKPSETGDPDWGKRAASALKAVIYGVICVSAVTTATGSGSSGGGGVEKYTKKLMDLPAGPWIVGAVALGIIAYGANLIRRAWTEKFREDLTAEGKSGDAGTAYIWFGKAGYTAKGVAFFVVGGLFAYAAISHNAKKSGGLDEALHKVLQQTYGPFLLAAIALGIGCYGLFCFARARYLSR
jgi:type IV secretory pathway VirB2 component (pilin)